MNVKFNGGGTLIFPNTFVDLPNGMLNWEWGPSTLQRLGKAQALRVYIYICMYVYNIYIYMYIYILYTYTSTAFISQFDNELVTSPFCRPSKSQELRWRARSEDIAAVNSWEPQL